MNAYIDAHRDTFGVEPICQTLAVAPSTYYAAKARPPSARALRDAELKPSISRVHAGSFAVYGTRKVWHQLCREGIEVGRDRVGRLMGELGTGIVDDATRSFRDYFYVLTIASLPVAVIVGLTAALMSLPLAFTIGLITFITSYIPYIGAIVSAAFAIIIAFGAGGVVPAAIMLVVILVAQNVVQPLIQRRLERGVLNLHPIVSFGSTIIGSVVAGVLGATLSAPFVAMVVRAYERIRDYRVGAAVDATDEPVADSSTSGPPAGR